jgi:hypothetical protein
MKPNILNPKWVYVPSHETDISKRFKKIIAEQKKQQAAQSTVVPMRKAGK